MKSNIIGRLLSLVKGTVVAGLAGSAICANAGTKLISNGQTLVFMGDSLTEYGEMMPWGYTHLVTEGLKANGVTVTWDGVGIRGQQASQMLSRFDKDVFANANVGNRTPDVVMIASGANDIGGGVSCDTYIANMMAMVDKVRAKGSTPIIAGPTASAHDENNNDNIPLFAHALRARAEQEGVAYAPWYEMFRDYIDDPETVVLSPYNATVLRGTCDGCHMAPAGDRVIALATLKAFGLDMDQLAKAEEAWNTQKLVTLVPVTYGAADQSITVSLTSSEASQVSTLDALQAVIERGAASLAANPTFEEPSAGASVNKTISHSLNPTFTFRTYDQLIIAARKLGIRVDQAVQCAILRGVRGGTIPAASAPVASVEEVITGVTTARFQANIESVGGSAGACDVILKYGTSASNLSRTQRIGLNRNAAFISEAVEGLAPDTTYSYELTFQNNASTVKSTKVNGTFRTKPSGSALAPSGNDDTPAIQAAINAAVASKGTVQLDGGVFQLDGELTLKGGVTLRGRGLTQTILHERGAHRVLLVQDGSKVVGVTVEGGKQSRNWDEGGGVKLLNGTVSECRVWRNSLWGGNNYGGGIYVETGTIDHSIVAFNSTSASSAGAAGIGANRKSGTVVIDTCLVYGNTTGGNGAGISFPASSQDITIRNSTIAGNIAPNCGGLYLFGAGNVKLSNSVVSGNVNGDDVNPVGSLKANTGNVIGSASFVDAVEYDFHLSSGDTVGYYANGSGSGSGDSGSGTVDPGTSGGSASGHEGVQLWANGPYFAKTNLGAEKETDVGCYFRFGETVGYLYTGSGWVDLNGNAKTGSWWNGTFTHTPASGTLPEQYDAAHALWGGSWRMMTASERDGLKNNCDWAWTTINGVNGMKFTGRGAFSGNSIFLPDGGWSGGPTPNGCAYYFTGEASGTKPCAMRFGTTYIALETVHNGDKAYPVRAVSTTAPGPSTPTPSTPDHTHAYGTPTYSWVGYLACSASASCTVCGAKKSEQGTVTSATTATATCTTAGRKVYTAAFATFASTSKTETIPAGHVWGTPSYVWSADGSNCTATVACTLDPSHVKTETVPATFVVTRQPTTRKTGLGHMVAVLTQDPFTPQNGPDIEIPAKGTTGGAAKSVTFTVNASSSETGYPILVKLSKNSPVGFDYEDCEADGSDLRFFDADDNQIPCEIDTWNTSGESLVWVKLPSVKAGATFTMQYAVTPEEENDASAVWSAYTGVWHLNGVTAETGSSLSQGIYANSTAEIGLEGHVSVSSVTDEAGRFGRSCKVSDSASQLSAAAAGGVWVNDAGANSPLDANGTFTISGWFKHQNWNYYWDHFFAKRNKTNSTDGSFSIEVDCANYSHVVGARGNGNTPKNYQSFPVALTDWSYITFVYEGSTCTIYQNGELVGSGTISPATDNNAPLVFGNTSLIATQAVGDSVWQGWIDEVRYLKGAKSADWIAAEYKAMTETIVTAGEVEEAGPVTPPGHTHVWGAATYSWSADSKSCTATRTCSDCQQKETETAKATLVVTKPATTAATGLQHYVASFKNTAFATQTGADIVIPKKEASSGSVKSVTFTVTQGSSESGFPILVKLAANSPAGFSYADCAAGGSDLRFFGADGAQLPSEIDTWNTSGESLVWVKLPSVATGTTFTMKYGSTPEEANNSAAVWSEYTGVWHLNGVAAETGSSSLSQGVYANSTAVTGLEGHVSVGSVTGEAGRFGSSFKVNDSTTQQNSAGPGGVWVNDAGANSPLDANGTFTISGWFKHQNWNYYWDHFFAKRTKTNSTEGSFSIEIDCANYNHVVGARGNGNTPKNYQTFPKALTDWSYITFVYEGTTCTVYQDGELVGSGTISPATDNNAPLVFGNTSLIATQTLGDSAWQGWIDEVRYLKGAKSAEWIAAEYKAMAETVVTAGAVESVEVEPSEDTWDVPGTTGGIQAKVAADGAKAVDFTSISLADGRLTVGFEAGKVDANGQTFGLICKERLTDTATFTINVALTDDGTGSATVGSLEGLTDKSSLFVLGIGPAK